MTAVRIPPSFTWFLGMFSVGELRARFMDSILSIPSPFRNTCRLLRTLSKARFSFSWIVRSWSAMQDLSISICEKNAGRSGLRNLVVQCLVAADRCWILCWHP